MERDVSICRMRTILKNLISHVAKFQKTEETTKEFPDSTSLLTLIEILEHLSHLVETRMRTSPGEERERASNLAAALVNGKKAREEADNFRRTLDEVRRKHRILVNEVEAEVQKERKFLEDLEAKRKTELDRKRQDLENHIKAIMDETLIEQRQIEAEIQLREIEYRATRLENLRRESELYQTRKNVEEQYLAILAKYDNDVGDLYRTMESLMKESDELQDKLTKLEETLRIQEIEYLFLKNERETAIRAQFLENLENFQRKRSAIIIQRTWRAYWERQLLRKKKKSKKKK